LIRSLFKGAKTTTWCLAIILFVTHGPRAAQAPAFLEQVREQLRNRIAEQKQEGVFVCKGEPICGIPLIPVFYEERRFAPVWMDSQGPRPTAYALIRSIRTADQEGLLPSDYHLASLESLLDRIRLPSSSVNDVLVQEWADFDLLLTDAFLLYGAHLSAGRLNPEALHRDWVFPEHAIDIIAQLHDAVTETQLVESLNRLRPRHPGYNRLKDALRDLRRIASQGGWPQIRNGPTIRPGDHAAEVLVLRHRLTISGDLPGDPMPEEPEKYDNDMVQAVVGFQNRHGLKTDGLVGRQTRDALNVTVQERIRQIELNLERWRWLPRQLSNRYLVVNTAAFQLSLIKNDVTVCQMRVVVGQKARKTPVFSKPMTYMVLNPYWHIPRSIAVEDLLPRIMEEGPSYLSGKGIRVFGTGDRDGIEMDPDGIHWAIYNRNHFPFQLRQDPGPANALGRIKFMFPNKFSVYIHDTNHRALFDLERRDFSSGCIRVEDALGLADRLLRDDPEWTSERLETVLKTSRDRVLRLSDPIMVHLIYLTAWVDNEGVLQLREDIYDRDSVLDRALKRRSAHQVRTRPVSTWTKSDRG
jgi:murein L,D-transpeptidase YcbB/YkuD